MRHKSLSIHTHYGLYAACGSWSCVRPGHVDVGDDDETGFAGWLWLVDSINGYVTLCVKARWEKCDYSDPMGLRETTWGHVSQSRQSPIV